MDVSRTDDRERPAHCPIDGLQPIFIWHVDMNDYVKVALLIWVFVYRHTLSTQNYRLARADNLTRRTNDFDASPIKVGYQYAREPKKCLGQCNCNMRKKIIARAFKGFVRTSMENEYNIADRETGLAKTRISALEKDRSKYSQLLLGHRHRSVQFVAYLPYPFG
jgi:hypothetical protein